MARKLAIDLGAYAVKVAWGSDARDGGIAALASARVPQDAASLPTLEDRLAVLDALLRAHPGWSDKAVVDVVWSTERTSARRLTLPFTERERIEQTVPFAIEQDVPFELDDMHLSWRPLDAPGQVLVGIALEDELSALIAGLAQRGLDPRRLVPDGEVLARFATYDDVATAVVDVGHHHTVVSVGRRGQALWFRSIDVAGRAFTRAIQEALGCAWGEAQALKHGDEDEATATFAPLDAAEEGPTGLDAPEVPGRAPSSPEPEGGLWLNMPSKARDALREAVALLLSEVRSSLIQAEDELGVEIDGLVLTGGSARLPGLRAWLEQDLGVTVQLAALSADPLLEAMLPPSAVDEGLRGGAAAVSLAVDMAVERAPDRLDFRTGELAWRGAFHAPTAVLRYGTAFLATFVVAAIGAFAALFYQYDQEQAAVEALIHDAVAGVIEELPADLEAIDQVALLAEVVGEAEQEAEFLGGDGAIPETVHELWVITKAFPAPEQVKVNVDRLEITPGAIMINGVTEGLKDVDTIGESLEKSGQFNTVETQPGARDGAGKLQFTINIDRTSEDDAPAEGESEKGEG
jgi:Tfp pilus assembly PilM family ATPase